MLMRLSYMASGAFLLIGSAALAIKPAVAPIWLVASFVGFSFAYSIETNRHGKKSP